jgi:hypothetical protein
VRKNCKITNSRIKTHTEGNTQQNRYTENQVSDEENKPKWLSQNAEKEDKT